LYRAVRERKLAGSVSAYNYSPAEVGIFVLNAECEPATTTAAAQALWTQLASIHDGVTESELERCKRIFASRWARRLEATEGQASYLAEWESIGGWGKGDAYYERFLSLTPSEVVEVAQRYLTPERAGAVVYRPKHEPQIAESAEAFQALLTADPGEPLDAMPPVIAADTPKSGAVTYVREENGVQVYQTAQGIPVLVIPHSGAAITYMGVYASGGAVRESFENAGLSALAMRTTVKGTTTRSAVQIAEASELLGGSISSYAGVESFGWSISVPRDNASAAAALLADVVQHATLHDDAIETERTVLLSELSQLRDDMYRYPMRLANRCAFDGHPYSNPATGTEESLRSLTGDDVRAWHRETLLNAPFVIGVVGDFDSQEIAATIAGAFGTLTMAEPIALDAPVWPASIQTAVEQRDKAQTAIALAFPAPSRRDETRMAVHVLATIASGLGGRFFDELRDRQSLAYTVHAFSSEFRLSGAFVAYIATSPDKEGVARDGLLAEFAKLREAPVTDGELRQAQRYILGMHDIRQERGGAVLGEVIDAWLSGKGLQELGEFSERIQQVTAADIQRLAQQYFDPAHHVEGIVRGVMKPGR